MGRRGLTLLELLIVIAIVAVLAGLLAGVAISARKKASAAQCASNLRQLGVGMHMYAADFQGLVLRCPGFLSDDRPSNSSDGSGKYHYMSWADAYARYFDPLWGQRGYTLEVFKLTKCPDHPLQFIETNYVVNAMAVERSRRAGGFPSKFSILSQIKNPAGVVYLADAANRVPPPRGLIGVEDSPMVSSYVVYSTQQFPEGAYARVAESRHGSGVINGLFFDGHVETVRTKNMPLSLWDDGIR